MHLIFIIAVQIKAACLYKVPAHHTCYLCAFIIILQFNCSDIYLFFYQIVQPYTKNPFPLSHVALPFCFLPWNTKGVIILQPFSHKWMRTKWEKWFKKGLFFRFPDIMIVFISLIFNHSWCNRRVAIKIVHNFFSFCSANSTSGLCNLSRLVLAIL